MRLVLAALLALTPAAVVAAPCGAPIRCGLKSGATLQSYGSESVAARRAVAAELEELASGRKADLPAEEVAAIGRSARDRVAALDSDGDGKVSRPEFFASVAKGGSIASSLADRGRKVAETNRFMSQDADGDGSVSAEEVASESVRQSAERADGVRQGRVSELKRSLEASGRDESAFLQAAGYLFAALDEDGDGVISETEVRTLTRFRGGAASEAAPFYAMVSAERGRRAAAQRAASEQKAAAERRLAEQRAAAESARLERERRERPQAPQQQRPANCVPFGGFAC